MNKYIVAIFCILQIFGVRAKDVDFAQANSAYSQKDYKKAQDMYLQLIDAGNHDAYLYYNLGNTYVKLLDYPHAVLYYEKALKINPQDKDIRNNLTYAYQKINSKYPDVAVEYPAATSDKAVSFFSISQWSKGMVIFLWIGVIFFLLYIFLSSQKKRRIAMMLTCSALIVSVFFLVMTFMRIQHDKVIQYVIVEDGEVYSKSDPSYNADNVYALVAGQKLKILDQSGDWIKVRNGSGDIAWMTTQQGEKL